MSMLHITPILVAISFSFQGPCCVCVQTKTTVQNITFYDWPLIVYQLATTCIIHSGYQTSIFGKNCAYYIRIYTESVFGSTADWSSPIYVWPTRWVEL